MNRFLLIVPMLSAVVLTGPSLANEPKSCRYSVTNCVAINADKSEFYVTSYDPDDGFQSGYHHGKQNLKKVGDSVEIGCNEEKCDTRVEFLESYDFGSDEARYGSAHRDGSCDNLWITKGQGVDTDPNGNKSLRIQLQTTPAC